MGIDCVLWFYCAVVFLSKIDGHVYPSIQWNFNNPIFKSNYTLSVLLMSKMNLVCPNDVTVLETLRDNTPKELLYENLWMVDKGGFDSCAVNTSIKSNRLLVKCNDPLKLKYFPLVFQQYSGTDWGLEFTPGRDYYFIATSDGTRSSLDDLSGGHCKTHNMKIKIHVCSNGDPHCIGTTPTSSPEVTTTRMLVSSTQTTTGTQLPTTVYTEPEFEAHVSHTEENRGLVNNSSQHQNTTTGSDRELPVDKRHAEVFGELKYQLAIGFLLAIIFVLLLLTIVMYFRFHQKLHLCFCCVRCRTSSQTTVPDASSKQRNSTASTRQILGVRFSGISEIDGSCDCGEECELSSE